MPSRDLRIGVVGAGPAGLTAAETLTRLGYSRVTVLERNAEVGGKVCSVDVGGRSYELGAYVVTGAYRTVLPLAAERGLELREAPPRVMVDVNGGRTCSFGEYLREQRGALQPLLAFARYWRLTGKHRALYGPCLDSAPRELCRPFGEFARAVGIDPLSPLLRAVFTGPGYGYVEEVPALYVLRFVDRSKLGIVVRSALGRSQGWPRVFATGFQELWRSVARGLDVRTGAEVAHIERHENGAGPRARLTLAGGDELEFDRLVLATPPPAAASMLDLADEERGLLACVRTQRYHATLFESDRIPGLDFTTAYLEQHQARESLGRTLLISHPHRDRDVYLAYAYGNATVGAEQIVGNLRGDVARLGGRVREVLEHRAWPDYSPKFDGHALGDGFLEKLDSIQGRRGTWYVGGLLGFETVEDAAAQSRATMERAFA